MDFARLQEFTPLGLDAEQGSVNVSPDGKYMAFILRQGDPRTNGYRSSWYVAPTEPGGSAINVGNAGEIQLMTDDRGLVHGGFTATSPAKWSPDGRWIAYLVKQAGEIQLWRSRADGSRQEQITQSDADVRDFVWADDGSQILFLRNRRTRAQLQRSREEEARRGFLVDGRLRPKYSLLPVFPREKEVKLWVHNFRDKEHRRATAQEEQSFAARQEEGGLMALIGAKKSQAPMNPYAGVPQHRPDVAAPVVFEANLEKRVAYASIVQPQDRITFPSAVVSMLSSRSPEDRVTCVAEECRGIIRKLWWSHDGEEIYFLVGTINMGSEGLYAWSPEEKAVRSVYELKGTEDLDRCVSNRDRLICLYSSPVQPPILASLDPRTGVLRTLVDPNPEFQAIDLHFTAPERLDWINEFGDETFGYLLKPRHYKPGQRYPLVILTYRAKGFLLNANGHECPAQLLAENGFVVLIFNRPYSHLIAGGDRGRYLDDFQDSRNVQASLDAGIALLDRRGLIDPERIAVTGLSNGTAITFFSIIHGKYKPAAAIVSSDTSGEPITYFLTSSGARRSMRENAGVVFSKGNSDSAFFNTVAPSRNIDKIRTPILFHLPDIELLASMQTIVTLEDYRKPFEAYVFPNEFHLKWQPAHLYNIYRRNVQWLKFWLQNVEDGEPVDPEQFTRWRKLRAQHEESVRLTGRL